jgi:hypothetical protein
MLYTIQFDTLSAMLLDFVDGPGEGFLYLRIAGAEPTVNAIWARLMAKETRGKKWGSSIQIPIPGRSYPEYVAADKAVYKTLRSRLPSGLVDLALIHPCLTVSDDTEQGFFLLTYEAGPPVSFFPRLNKTLSIPLQPEWAEWLWVEGQKLQAWMTVETYEEQQGGQAVEGQRLVQTSQTPIHRYDSRGRSGCYRIGTGGLYKAAWLQIIREQLGLGIRLLPTQTGARERYEDTVWSVSADASGRWILNSNDEDILVAPTLEFLLAQARDQLGRHFIIPARP